MLTTDFGLTIVIPTKGRDTLKNTILSLHNQSDKDWKAIVVCDGFDPYEWLTADPRIKAIKCDKTGQLNHAGGVRNYGIKCVDTKWIGFVDDDDILASEYVARLKKYDELVPDVDIVIFTMDSNGTPIPSRWNNDIVQNDVGISYAYKSKLSLVDGYYFRPSSYEDYDHLIRMSSVARYMIDREISYIVRPEK